MRQARSTFGAVVTALALAITSLGVGLGVGVISSGAPAGAATCTKTWESAVDGLWRDPQAWTPTGMPTSADDVCITLPGSYTVSLDSVLSAKSVQVGAATGPGRPELSVIAIGNLGGEIVSDARLTVSGNIDVTPFGIITLTRSGIQVSDASIVGGAGSVLANNGTVRSIFGNGAGGRTLQINVSNNAGATMNIDHPTTFSGTTFTNNGGTVALTQPLEVTRFANFVNTAGTIGATGSGQLQKTGTGSPGTSNGTFTQGNGTTTGNPVEIRGANVHFNGTGAASFVLHGANVLSGTIASGQNLNLETVRPVANSTTTLTAPVTNNGTITLTRFDPGAGGGADTTSITSATPGTTTLTNNGTISSVGCCFNRFQTNVVNGSGGTVNINASSSVEGTATFTNNGGTVALTQPLEVTRFANFVNTAGTIGATGSGQLQKTGTGSPGTSNGTFTQGNGTTTGNPVEIRGANVHFNGTGAASFVLHGANVLSGTIASGQNLNLETVRPVANSTTTLTAPVTNNGTITLTRFDPGAGGGADTTSITSATPGTTTLTNNGTISSVGCCFRALQTNIVNNAGGTIAIDNDFSATTVGNGAVFENRGLLTVGASRQLTINAGSGFTQTATGTFRTTNSNGAHGRLVANSNVTLAGTIAATTNYSPAVGTAFTVVTFPSRTGTFTGTSFSGSVNYSVTHTATAVQLVVAPAVTVPGAPTIGAATSGNGQATVSWTAPATTGGAAINDYIVTPFVGATAQAPRTFASTATTQTVTGLANGTTYTFRVAARNSAGTGTTSAASNAVTPATPHQKFVKAAYADFLNRAPTPTELAQRSAALDAGTLTRGGLVRALSTSSEYASALVQKLYQDTLGRPGEPAGVTYWANEIRSGRKTVAVVAANFYGSPEYFTGIGGGTNRSWVEDLYVKILLRAPETAGVDFWVGQTVARGRVNVALRFFQSLESRETRVKTLYQALLGRAPEAGGLSYWAGRIEAEGDLALAANLAASAEYLNRAQSRF